MSDGTAVAEQRLAEHGAIRDQLARAQVNLRYAVENALEDLGEVGHHRAELILGEIADELDDVMDLVPDE